MSIIIEADMRPLSMSPPTPAETQKSAELKAYLEYIQFLSSNP